MGDRLHGTVALVTGASSGIGEATATALAEEGARVALVARRADRLEQLAGKIATSGGTAIVVPADITVREQARDVVARTVSELGRLDTVVNNAGVMLLGPAAEAPIDEWERMVDVNVNGLLYVTRAAIPHLLDAVDTSPRRVADLVNVSSTAGRLARSGSAVYNLTKFGVGALTESLRQEFTQRRVRISVIEPGVVRTELTNHLRDGVREQTRERLSAVEPLQAEDIADAIVYIVTRPAHVAVNEILVRPTDQHW
jgi:NADP-dependent 3-hydroxy acid dehydrogenase YdfG